MSADLSRVTLAIEAAVDGGSVALFVDGSLAAGSVGERGVFRAEDLLPNIGVILRYSGIPKHEISDIVVSGGPGSFTGIRIGLSTAIGLATGLRIPLRRISTLDAIAHLSHENFEITVALPVGRDTVCIQHFRSGGAASSPSSAPRAISILEFEAYITNITDSRTIVNESLFQRVEIQRTSHLVNVGSNLAELLGRSVIETEIDEISEPLFVGKQFSAIIT